MANSWPRRGAGPAVILLGLAGCSGGHREGSRIQDGAFQVQVSPASLSIPAGGGGFVTVSAARPLPHYLDYQGDLSLSLQGAPAGVRASGTLAADHTAGTLALYVDASVAPANLANLRVVASGGGWTASAPFQLAVAPALPPGQIRADGVQASGQAQAGGTLANTPVIQEPVAATSAQDSVQVLAVRHGFLPDAPTH